MSVHDDAPRVPWPEFVRGLAAELRASGFARAGWRRFFARGWARSRAALSAVPSRTHSFLIWAVVGGVLGVGALWLAASARPAAGWLGASVVWGAWYAGAVALGLLILDMLESDEGVPYRRMLLPNVLTFIRLGHAPLVASALAAAGGHSLQAKLICVYLGVVAGTDLIDGWLARTLRQTSPLGAMLDALADAVLLAALATGLHRHGMISSLLLALVWVRYPGAIVGNLVLSVVRGPVSLRHTLVGRATSFAAAFTLVAAAVELIASPRWLPHRYVQLGLHVLTGLLAINIVYLIYRAVRPGESRL